MLDLTQSTFLEKLNTASAKHTAHAEFPYALRPLSVMCALLNGARVAVFATAPSPLTLVAINVNYAQTRKSSITGLAETFGQELDAVILKLVEPKLQQYIVADAVEPGGFPRVRLFFVSCKFCLPCFEERSYALDHWGLVQVSEA